MSQTVWGEEKRLGGGIMSERRKDAWEKSECLTEGRLFWEE
jgi:hypothetical protein